MKKLNNKLDVMTQPLMSLALWLPRIALGVAFFFHGYGKLPAPFMMVEQHRMVTWFESEFLPMPELLVNMVILGIVFLNSFKYFLFESIEKSLNGFDLLKFFKTYDL